MKNTSEYAVLGNILITFAITEAVQVIIITAFTYA